MGDSSDSEEFYDAEEDTPVKGSKRSSICKNTTPVDGGASLKAPEKEKVTPPSPQVEKPEELESRPTTADSNTQSSDVAPAEDDKTTVKNVVQGRRRFAELRRCMQAEEEDGPEDDGSDVQGYVLERPFKIRSHDTMSLQSMTSLGRIGKILSGAAESHPNIRETRESAPALSLCSREPSTVSDDPLPGDSRSQNVLAMAEPDVIASTKANSLKGPRGAPPALTAVSGRAHAHAHAHAHAADTHTHAHAHAHIHPVPPPRRKKRNKLYGSQSLSTTDGDNISVCTTDTDNTEYRFGSVRRPLDRAQLESLAVEASGVALCLPSPASTIESLTREFQDSLELSQSKYASATERCSGSSGGSRSGSGGGGGGSGSGGSGGGSGYSGTLPPHRHQIDSAELSRGESSVRTSDLERGAARTHSETRAHTGHGSLGSQARRSNSEGVWEAGRVGAGRRRSAGDELLTALTHTHPHPPPPALTDMQILEQVTVLNLDTGERVPLSIAEHKLPQCMNPLSLHIMRLTSEYIARRHDDDNPSPMEVSKPALSWHRRLYAAVIELKFRRKSSLHQAASQPNMPRNRETDEESESVCAGGTEDEAKEPKRESADRQTTAIRKKTDKIKRFFGSTVKKTVDAAKSLAQEVSHARHKEDVADIADDVRGETNIKLKASNSHKGPYDFDGCVRHVQEMSSHMGAVWCCKFSVCGRLLATAGQDKLLRTWVTRDSYHMFQDMRTKYNLEQKCSPSPSEECVFPGGPPPLGPAAPFCPQPFAVYSGHTSDLLDVSWSKNYFLLSSSMDKTVRLWHISRAECLCCFQHIDFVTAIVFHPRDDRYFLSGSLDGKIRLWNIPDKKVAVWNEVGGKTKLITAANFCQNGKFAVVGTYDGRCIFYTTDQLKYHTQIDVRSARGKNSTGRKISGIEPMPNDDKILVTSNDSRIRLYDLRDLNLSCKYKGYVNVSSQIKASFSHDGKYIVSGSENQCIYIWKTYHDYSKFSSVRRDRNDYWEGIKAHNVVVTCAVFAPNPEQYLRAIQQREREMEANTERDGEHHNEKEMEDTGMVASTQTGQVLVSADFNGCIKVFLHKAKAKHSSLPASALA